MPLHQPFWCEENIWHLCADPAVGPGERYVAMVTGTARQVACWDQRCAEPGGAVLWDYHVILLSGPRWQVWDLDTRAPCPCPVADWTSRTFPIEEQVTSGFRPRFVVVPAATYRKELWSDRRHMLLPDGTWTQPPPPWQAIESGTVPLASWLARARAGIDLAAFAERFTGG